MKPEIKAEWVKRLRSGNYTQGREALRTDEGSYCCLGVLCAIAVERGIVNDSEFVVDISSGPFNKQLPSDRVDRWAGLEDYEVTIDGITASLPKFNDMLNKTFAELADAIEEQL